MRAGRPRSPNSRSTIGHLQPALGKELADPAPLDDFPEMRKVSEPAKNRAGPP